MRSVSLSNPKVINLLNRYFVNVYVSNEDFRGTGSASLQDRAELRRIFDEGLSAGLSVGTVHAYVLRPSGHLMDSRHVAQAAKGAPLVEMLEKSVKALGAQPGAPSVQPAPQPAPVPPAGSVMLHLVARYLERRGSDLVITGQGENRGNWSDNPGEDWLTFTDSEVRRLVPESTPAAGDRWAINPDFTARIYARLYPPTESNDLAKNQIESMELNASLVSVRNGVALARMEGAVTMKHPFYHKDDGNRVRAGTVGYFEFDTRSRRLRMFHLVTDQATYGGDSPAPFGAAVELSRGAQ